MRVRTIVFCLVASLALAAGWLIYKRLTPISPLVGDWELRFTNDMPHTPLPAGMEPHWTLTFRNDGIFEEHVENHVMMDMVSNSKGTYKVEGKAVQLDGMSTTTMDDGYKKGTETNQLHRILLIRGDMLTMEGDSKMEAAFVRVGSPSLPTQNPPKPESSLEARKLLKDVERQYASLKTYSDEGTLKSSGKGFMFSDARFQTRFSRPGKFLFRIDAYENGKPYQANAVWSNGKDSWVYEGMDGALGKRSISDGLSTYSPIWGYETVLIPALLMPAEFKRGSLSAEFPGVTFGQDEKVEGVDCRVLRLTFGHSFSVTLWIDKKSNLILKAYDAIAGATITFHPRAGATLNDKDFIFSPPK